MDYTHNEEPQNSSIVLRPLDYAEDERLKGVGFGAPTVDDINPALPIIRNIPSFS